MAEGDGVLDPKHVLFLFEEETKVISYTMSKGRDSQCALAINSTTPGHWNGEKDLESILRIPQTAVQTLIECLELIRNKPDCLDAT